MQDPKINLHSWKKQMCTTAYGHDMNIPGSTPVRWGKHSRIQKSILEYLYTQNLVMGNGKQNLLYGDKNLLLPWLKYEQPNQEAINNY